MGVFLSLSDFVFRNKVCSLQQLEYYKHLCCEVPLFDFSFSSVWMHCASLFLFSLNSDSLFKCMATLIEICMGLKKSGWLMVMEWMCAKFVCDFKFFVIVLVVIVFQNPGSWRMRKRISRERIDSRKINSYCKMTAWQWTYSALIANAVKSGNHNLIPFSPDFM